MSDYITTYTGIHFVPADPDPKLIHIEDIAHALSLICRGNGHVKTFLSVGQHCIRCAQEARARGLSVRVVLACLLHDASEAYMSDVPRPFKKYLKEYNELEEQLLSIIFQKYLGSDLTDDEKKQVRSIDDDVLYYDLKVLLNEQMDVPRPLMKVPFVYGTVPFEEVEKQYLDLFYELSQNI